MVIKDLVVLRDPKVHLVLMDEEVLRVDRVHLELKVRRELVVTLATSVR